MNAKYLTLSVVAAMLAISAVASDAFLSPRAQGDQIRVVHATMLPSTIKIVYADSAGLLSPRAQDTQLKVVKGGVQDQNPALECMRSMPGTPRAVTACS